jgi:two-component system KDP operon response regulator KdpE
MSPEPFRVLVVAENPELRQLLRKPLVGTGFALEECGGAAEALKMASEMDFDLVLLDLSLSGGAIATCRRLRELFPRIGIVVVRDGGTPEDEVQALEAGADDCVASPFRFREVVARLAAVLRRARVENLEKNSVLRAGALEVDIQRRLCRRSGKKIHLSPKEFDLLVYLMKSPGVTVPHLKILRAVWGPDSRHDAVYLRSYIKALRKKIEADPGRPEFILTEPWVGYLFQDPSSLDGARRPSEADSG